MKILQELVIEFLLRINNSSKQAEENVTGIDYSGYEIISIADLVSNLVQRNSELTISENLTRQVVDLAMDISGTLFLYKEPWSELSTVSSSWPALLFIKLLF